MPLTIFTCSKKINMKLPSFIISWIFGYLADTTAVGTVKWRFVICYLYQQWCISRQVLAPVLFFLYTDDYWSTDGPCPLMKFSDDTELVGKMSNDDDAPYHTRIESFVNWFDKNYLRFNFLKVKRCVLTLGRSKHISNQSTFKEKQWRG